MDDGLVDMLGYDRWATRRLLERCRELQDPVLDARIPGFSGSTRELLLHLVGGQQTFVLRTKGRQHEGELNRDSAWPGWDVIMQLSASTSDALLETARSVQPGDVVDLPYLGKRYGYPVQFFLVHAVAHGAEHRTEIKLQLGQQGIETPDLDGWAYAEARGYGAEAPGSGAATPG
jgi:uncharacterized damage-inducible protein DinB